VSFAVAKNWFKPHMRTIGKTNTVYPPLFEKSVIELKIYKYFLRSVANTFHVQCLFRLILYVSCCADHILFCVCVCGPFCHGALTRYPVCFVCNIFSLNISTFYNSIGIYNTSFIVNGKSPMTPSNKSIHL